MAHSAATYQTALEKLHQYLHSYAPLTRSEFRQMEPYLEIREFDKKVKVIHEGARVAIEEKAAATRRA